MFMRTQRLFLRPVWAEDWADILAGVDDVAVARNLAAVPWPYSEPDAHWFASQPQDPRYPHFLVTRPHGADGVEALGCMGLRPEPGRDGGPQAALGFWIARAHWGRGYATEAGRALLSLARVLGHRRLTAAHFLDNPASGRVLCKLGFRSTGEVVQRASPARCVPAPASLLAIDLELDGNGGGDFDDGDIARPMVTLRAA